jgi:DNA-binding NarL/FixJ family response regulator
MTPESTNAPKRVFLVDDHPLVREWLGNLLNQQPDFTVCGEASSALEAMDGILDKKPDVAIVDLTLKDSSGIELIKNLKVSAPSLRILVLSMHEDSHYAERALRAGANGYIMKRETTGKLVEALRQVLAGKLYMSQEIAFELATYSVNWKTMSDNSPGERLSDRELEVFELLGQGRGTRLIAEHLRVSAKTVQAYCARIKEKLHLDSAGELMREAVRWHESKNRQ